VSSGDMKVTDMVAPVSGRVIRNVVVGSGAGGGSGGSACIGVEVLRFVPAVPVGPAVLLNPTPPMICSIHHGSFPMSWSVVALVALIACLL
jgi:hypothetical protein